MHEKPLPESREVTPLPFLPSLFVCLLLAALAILLLSDDPGEQLLGFAGSFWWIAWRVAAVALLISGLVVAVIAVREAVGRRRDRLDAMEHQIAFLTGEVQRLERARARTTALFFDPLGTVERDLELLDGPAADEHLSAQVFQFPTRTGA